ncbi:hypothetical protein BJV78DRAFT_556724 [Lactifluus subvellereus]|nr:hypothetical protein BJV78DRAFT_556724 [Lactifluus subvellereus]
MSFFRVLFRARTESRLPCPSSLTFVSPLCLASAADTTGLSLFLSLPLTICSFMMYAYHQHLCNVECMRNLGQPIHVLFGMMDEMLPLLRVCRGALTFRQPSCFELPVSRLAGKWLACRPSLVITNLPPAALHKSKLEGGFIDSRSNSYNVGSHFLSFCKAPSIGRPSKTRTLFQASTSWF